MKAIKGKIVYTGKKLLKDKYIHYEGKEIKKISGELGDSELVGEYEVVTPAFIDAHSHIALSRAGEPYDEEDVNEQMDSIITLIDALDSVQMDDVSLRDSVEHGVLYSCVLPGSGNIIGGRSALIRNYSKHLLDAFIKHTGLKAAFGYNPKSTTDWKGTRPNTRMGAVALLREALIKASNTKKLVDKKKKEPEEMDPDEKVLIDLLEGKERLRVHVHKQDDIAALIRLKREFNLKMTIEHAGDVHSREIFDLIAKEGIPVIFGPIDGFAYKTELKHESWKNVKYLLESGVEYGLMTDHPVMLQRNLLHQLRYFLRFGVSKEKAIGVITYNNAKILGIEDKLGSIEEGKWASLVGWSGDPFSLESWPKIVIGEGEILHQLE